MTVDWDNIQTFQVQIYSELQSCRTIICLIKIFGVCACDNLLQQIAKIKMISILITIPRQLYFRESLKKTFAMNVCYKEEGWSYLKMILREREHSTLGIRIVGPQREAQGLKIFTRFKPPALHFILRFVSIQFICVWDILFNWLNCQSWCPEL